MAVSIKHAFNNPIADDPTFTGTKPSDWNAEHSVSGLVEEAPIDGTAYARKDGGWVAGGTGGGAVDSVNGQTGVVVLDAGDVGAIPTQVATDTGEPTGFVDTTATLSFTSTGADAGTFTITGAHDIYLLGVKHSKTTTSLTLTGAGAHYILYDTADATLKEVAGWYLGDGPACVCAVVYIDGTNYILQEERHGITMDWQTHHYLHDTRGSVNGEGGALAVASNCTFTLDSYDHYDEDIEISQAASTTAMILTRKYSGGSYQAGTTILATANGTIDYRTNGRTNFLSNGTLTETDNFVCYYVYGSTTNNPCVIAMGRAAYTTLALARAEVPDKLADLAGIYSPEFQLYYKVIVRNETYQEQIDYRRVSNIPSGGTSPTDHQSLANRSATGSHPGTAIEIDASGFNGNLATTDVNVQMVAQKVDDFNPFESMGITFATSEPDDLYSP